MKMFWAAAAFAAVGLQAEAAIVEYSYLGGEVELWDPVYWELGPDDPAPRGDGYWPWSGFFRIDTSLFPVALGGAVIDLFLYEREGPLGRDYPVSGTISNGSAVYTISSELDEVRGSLFPAIGLDLYDGHASTLPFGALEETVLDSLFFIAFADDGEVLEWSGSMAFGGSSDMASGGRNGFIVDVDSAGTQSFAVGRWTRTVIVPDAPSPVPLPATGGLLFAGIAGLALARQRRRRSPAE